MPPLRRDGIPVEDIYKINQELENYNAEIAARPQVIAANKIDSIYVEEGGEDPFSVLKTNLNQRVSKCFLYLR